MSAPTVHVAGAGLAGLSAALSLVASGRKVVIHEAATNAGGRCRSLSDAVTGLTIDNGNHLLLSGNRATLGFLNEIGSAHLLAGPPEAVFPFVDAVSGERWTLRPNRGRIPWWIGAPGRRVPGSRLHEYLAILRLFTLPAKAPLGTHIGAGPLYHRLWRPVLLASLNTAPEQASAGLAKAIVRETLGAGGSACRPLIAVAGLTPTFIAPALARLQQAGTSIRYSSRLKAIGIEDNVVRRLHFAGETVELVPGDGLVLAVPPQSAGALVPGLSVPEKFRAILNVHFAIAPPAGHPQILAILNATAQWLFAFPDRLSVTVSGADSLIDTPNDVLAAKIWGEIAPLAGLATQMPPWRVIKERRATFAATPLENARRPPARTGFSNLALAGDWTATGLPATIEGAIRSGRTAAATLAAARGRRATSAISNCLHEDALAQH